MPVEVGDAVRLDLTLGDGDDYLARADGEIGEVVDGDIGAPNPHLVAVEIDGETVEVLAAEHEVRAVAEVDAA